MKSRLADRVRGAAFLLKWLRRPTYEIAESVIRLRKLRGLTQAQLAERMGTKQPAVARIEAGLTDLRFSTTVRLAEALDAVVMVKLEPAEMCAHELSLSPWWSRAQHLIKSFQEFDKPSAHVHTLAPPSITTLRVLHSGRVRAATPYEEPADALVHLPTQQEDVFHQVG